MCFVSGSLLIFSSSNYNIISAWAGYSSKKEHTLVCVLRIIKHESLIAFSLYVSLLEGNEF